MIINYYHTFLLLFGFLNILLTFISFSMLRKIALRPKPVVVKTRIGSPTQSRVK